MSEVTEERKRIFNYKGVFLEDVKEILQERGGETLLQEKIQVAIDFLQGWTTALEAHWKSREKESPEIAEKAKDAPGLVEGIKDYIEDTLADGKTPENFSKVIEFLDRLLKNIKLDVPGGESLPDGSIAPPTSYSLRFNLSGERAVDIIKEGDTTQEVRDPLIDLENIRNSPKSDIVKASKDLWRSQIEQKGDVLEYIKDEKIRRNILKKAKEGKYIAGTLVGLAGGERYFKVFCLALAQTLNEQSKYYKTEEDLSGVPQELLSQYAGEGAIVDNIKAPLKSLKGKKGEVSSRPYPIIFLSWEDLAKKMSATGKLSGGKDIKQVRDYVLGGMRKEKDKKTGKEKKVYVPGLLGREYFIEGTNGIIGVPLMTKILSLYPKDSPDKEVGIAVQLSPLFSYDKVIGYTGIRSDTIQLLGGGKQRELTINLFMFLAYYRGVTPQKGRKRGEFIQKRKDLLDHISQGLSSYNKRPGLLETHFHEAIQKCIDCKILLPGRKGKELRGYREEINPGGERLSIFVYNPDYLKGEEINLFSGIEDQ